MKNNKRRSPSSLSLGQKHTADNQDTSSLQTGLLAFNKRSGSNASTLIVNVLECRNLPPKDANGKADPYCVIIVGNQIEKTKVESSTLNPKWLQAMKFEIDHLPHVDRDETKTANGRSSFIVHYVKVDVWDRDRLNYDDFIGRVMIPLAFITSKPINSWFPLGRVNPKDHVIGDIRLELSLTDVKPIENWYLNEELYSICGKFPQFELPLLSGGKIIDYPGEAEQIEMMFNNVVIEVAKQRGVGQVFLTNFRLIFIWQAAATSQESTTGSDMSMSIPINCITAVEKGGDEKVYERSTSGSIVHSEAKSLYIRCADFRAVRFSFLSGKLKKKRSYLGVSQMNKSASDSSLYFDASDNDIVDDLNIDEGRASSNESFSDFGDHQNSDAEKERTVIVDEKSISSIEKETTEMKLNSPIQIPQVTIGGDADDDDDDDDDDEKNDNVDIDDEDTDDNHRKDLAVLTIASPVSGESETEGDYSLITHSKHMKDYHRDMENERRNEKRFRVKLQTNSETVQVSTSSNNSPVHMKQPRSSIMDLLRNRANDALAYANSKVSEITSKSFSNAQHYYFSVLYERLCYHTSNSIYMPPAFAFAATRRLKGIEVELDHWDCYDSIKEVERQGMLQSNKWWLNALNYAYTLCDTYPHHIYVPMTVQDDVIKRCAQFRSRSRIPCLCWYDSNHSNVMMRSAQPSVGPMGKYSIDDEKLISEARLCNPNSKEMVIFDARSVIAASGNKLKGKGTEDISNRYIGCRLIHLNIANIHAMRESLDKLFTACDSATDKKWLSQLESTQWLQHLKFILKGATMVAQHISQRNISALVHCSDGWDRTAQLTSLAQLMLDSHYRTIDGFIVLIEKEWLSFGHKFADRINNPALPNQRSPVFLQFLDCVWQIMQQFPSAFEFNAVFLLRIADHFGSGWFGNFLYNCERERKEVKLSENTPSLWAHIMADKSNLTNLSYSKTTEVILPCCSLKRIHLWDDYYLRYSEASSSLRGSADVDETDDIEDFSANDTEKSSSESIVWVPDIRATECFECKQRFTAIRRKHHCRSCGQVFCRMCTRHKMSLSNLGYRGLQRVCDHCFYRNKTSGEQKNSSD